MRRLRIMWLTVFQDHDGSHIKGLIINFLDHFYPSLLKLPEFLVEFVTPIVRVTKGKDKKNFFTLPEFEQWLEDTPNSHLWTSKYYKGLGTSKSEDARDYFSHMARHMIPFATTQEGDRELIDLAFSKKKADDRKEWLRQLKVQLLSLLSSARTEPIALYSPVPTWTTDLRKFRILSSSIRS